MKKAALYVRVSTAHQIDKDSLPFQRQELINYSKYALGIDDFEIFEDAGYSAKNTDRPDYQEMMSRIRNREFSHMIVWKIDRISRNLKDFTEMYDEIKEYDVTFVSKNEQFDTSSAMGEAMLKIILVFAELERKLTAERVFSIMLSRAEKGLWNGSTLPIGYMSNESKTPTINEDEALTIRYIYSIYEKTASTSQTAFQLNSENVKTKRGGKWTSKTVNDILRSPFYIGTYRYNTKSSGTRRWKDKKEWVVVENNHPAIISSEQFKKVNDMLDKNFNSKGNVVYQRSNSHVHIFSKMLVCNQCDNNLFSATDRARADGYTPSKYICYSNKYIENTNNCNNFTSDVKLLPFVLNYISNFINLQNKITANHSLRDIEKILLRGNAFIDLLGINRAGLEETYLSFAAGFEGSEFTLSSNNNDTTNIKLEELKKEKQKYEKALTRLEDLYLFSDESMSQKDFLFKKRDITKNIEVINDKFMELHKESNPITDISFLNKANNFLINSELSNRRNIDYRELLSIVDKTMVKDFITTVIKSISIEDKRIFSITFQNGITHEFIYKEKEQQKFRTKEKFLYRSYEPTVIEYLKENGSITRKEIEILTGISNTGALSIIKELTNKNLIEKRGNSVAIRYFFIGK